MTEDQVRERAAAIGEALVAGDVDRVIESLSEELRRNVGEVVALLPLPASEATIESLESTGGGAAFVVVLAVVGESDEVQLQLRWKDRGGEPRIVEVSHLSRTPRPEDELTPAEGEAASPEDDAA